MFLGKSNENDLKNKEAIMLLPTSITDDGETTTLTGTAGPVTVYELVQLKNKHMVWRSTQSNTDGNSSNTSEGRYELKQ